MVPLMPHATAYESPWLTSRVSVTCHVAPSKRRGRPPASAAADCDMVVIATPWDSAATIAQEHADALRGKIVVSMANALVRVGHEFQPLVPPRGSVAAHVQAAVPRSRVVAAFHHLPGQRAGRDRPPDRLRRADLR